MENDLFRYPTSAEMRAIEIAARRARAQEMARVFRAGTRALKSLLKSLAARLAMAAGKRVSHA